MEVQQLKAKLRIMQEKLEKAEAELNNLQSGIGGGPGE